MSSLPVVPDFPDGLSEERDELSPLVTFDQVRTEKSIYLDHDFTSREAAWS